MNRMNRKIEYALMALKHMSSKAPGELTTAKEVSEKLRTPFDATARVMQLMAQTGLLKSEHGAFGGYFIQKDLGQISIFDLLQQIEGPSALVKCLQKNEGVCEIQEQCNILSPVTLLNQKLNDFYSKINLKALLIESDQHFLQMTPLSTHQENTRHV